MRLGSNQIEVIDDRMADVLKRKTPAERLNIGFGLWHSTTVLLTSFIKSLHPKWDEKMIQKEVVRRISNGAI
ncbi:MAG: hypothetical protein V1871_09615 [Planctomycetota bacterium]